MQQHVRMCIEKEEKRKQNVHSKGMLGQFVGGLFIGGKNTKI
jgi:hypothetical protein